jgi:hypothetical protein
MKGEREMGKTLQIDEDKMLELAGTCKDWERGLKKLFPESFQPKVQHFVWDDIQGYLPVGKGL